MRTGTFLERIGLSVINTTVRAVGRGLCGLCEFNGMSTPGSPLVNFSTLENLKYQISVCSCHFDSATISHEQENLQAKDKRWVAAFRSEQGSIAAPTTVPQNLV